MIRNNIKLRHAKCVMQVPRTPFGTLETHASQGPTLATGLIVFIKNVGAKGPMSRAKLNQFKFDKLLIESWEERFWSSSSKTHSRKVNRWRKFNWQEKEKNFFITGDSKTLSNFTDQAEMFRPNDRKVSELVPVI